VGHPLCCRRAEKAEIINKVFVTGAAGGPLAPFRQPSEARGRADKMGRHDPTRGAVFLDRDGVLNRPCVRDGHPYPPADVEEFELYEDVLVGCRRLKEAGFLLVVVSNQPDVGRGRQLRGTAEAINQKLANAIPQLDRIEVRFHASEDYGDVCDCRKPKPQF